MNIYELSKVTDNSAYEGFACDRIGAAGRGQLVVDAFGVKYLQKRPMAPLLAKTWEPIMVEGDVHPLNDYPCINGHVPAFSDRVVAAMREDLTQCGELLPFHHQGRQYWAYNVQKIPEVLDRERSAVTWGNPKYGVHAGTIDRFEFHRDRIDELFIFRLYEQTYTICVTQRFVDTVKRLSFNGFVFYKLWPLGEDEIWWRLRNRLSAENEKLPPPSA